MRGNRASGDRRAPRWPDRQRPADEDRLPARGALTVPDRGRWFVYAEMRRDGEPVESWLPIAAGGERTSHFEAARYAYVPAEASGSLVKVIGGVLLYAAMAALIVATFVLIARSARDPSTGRSRSGGHAVMARAAMVLADHGSLSVSLTFFGPVLLMLAALALMTWRERRRRRATEDER
jgi:hypothetical protein